MDENGVLFSVIVPAYQVENYIGQCIESLIPQCETNSEIIIVDDGSTDKSGMIADEYTKNYKFIKVIHQENKGQSEARNVGIHHAKGMYCIFVDGDDMLCEGAMDSLKKCIVEKQNPEVIIHRGKQIDSAGEIKECSYWFDETQMRTLSISAAFNKIQKMPELWFTPWLISVRVDYIRKNNFYFAKGLTHEDEEWVPKILLNTNKVAYHNNCFYCYRIDREGSTTKSPRIKRIFDKLSVIDLLRNEFIKSKYSADIKEVVEERIRSIYFGIVCAAWQYRKDERYKELVQLIKRKRGLLSDSNYMKHKICYIFVVFLGVRMTCFCFWHINNVRMIINKIIGSKLRKRNEKKEYAV